MSVSYVEPEDADEQTREFYDRAEETFEMVLNIFKVFGHTPELGKCFTDSVMAMLKDAELDWATKELIILKATHHNACQYCVVQHEAVSQRLGITSDKIAEIEGTAYRDSDLFTPGEVALLDFTAQIAEDANRVPKELFERLHEHWTEPQIVEAAYVATQYLAIS
ncbi:MAG: carboxymuconolactone decarboxylase family protein, partial [Myxococcota bacterium]